MKSLSSGFLSYFKPLNFIAIANKIIPKTRLNISIPTQFLFDL